MNNGSYYTKPQLRSLMGGSLNPWQCWVRVGDWERAKKKCPLDSRLALGKVQVVTLIGYSVGSH